MEGSTEVLAIGDVVGERYVVERRVGRGGMGAVFEAKDQRLGRQVALKALASPFANDDARERLEAEARAVASLDHPGIVTLYDVVAHGAETVLVMELVVGESLRDLLEGGPVDPHEVARLVTAAADALAAAHARGLVHRDVKPDNLMRRSDGRIALLDFGIAKVTENHSAEPLLKSVTGGALLGTPAYLAPEQALGEPITAATDQFALGVLTYELLTGALPWRSENLGLLIAEIVTADPPPVFSLRPELNPAIDATVARALEKSPANRFPDIRDFANALSSAMGETEVLQKPPTVSPLSQTVTGSVSRPEQERIATESAPLVVPPPRRFWKAATAVGICLALGAIVTTFYVRHDARQKNAVPSSSATDVRSSSIMAELPPSKTESSGAAQKYQDAMRALSVSNARRARDLLDGAIKDDPHFASALLQRAYLGLVVIFGLDEPSRAAYRSALEVRTDLSTRDAGFLDAIGPSFVDPPNWKETASRLARFVEARPGDEQGWIALAVVHIKLGEAELSLQDSTTALSINPKSGMASLFRGQLTLQMGDTKGGRKLLEACVEALPENVSCRAMLGLLMQDTGACVEADRIGRELTSLVPENPLGYELRAAASAGLGSPDVAIRELLDKRAAVVPETSRKAEKAFNVYRMALRHGDFTNALQALDTAESGVDPNNAEALSAVVYTKATVLLEMGDAAKAGSVAADFLQRTASRAAPERSLRDPTPRLLAFMHAGGALDDAAYRKRRDDWAAAWRTRLGDGWKWEGNGVWLMAFAPLGDPTLEEANEALAARKDFEALTQPMLLLMGNADSNSTYFTSTGALLLTAGQLDEAKTDLRLATSACTIIPDVRAHYLLAKLYAKEGDEKASCDELAIVDRFWGQAVPRSVTADAAHELAKKCPATH